MVIKNGRIIDGTGNPWFRSDIGIKNCRIYHVGRLNGRDAEKVIDARGLIVSPGFIDIHTHSDLTLLVNPKAESKVRQGVTTETIGSCGFSAAPVKREALDLLKKFMEPFSGAAEVDWNWSSMNEYLSRLEAVKPSINVVALVGHGTIRINVMGFDIRSPNAKELEEMKQLVAEAMEDGAFGISSGLGYSPASYAKTEELIELCKVVAEHGGFYSTHLRDEADRIIEAAKEAVEIGEKSGVSVEISHYKPEGRVNWGRTGDSLKVVEEARAKGVEVTYDVYPYLAGEAPVSACFVPPWAHEGGTEKMLERLKDADIRARIKREAKEGLPDWTMNLLTIATWNDFLISFCKKNKDLQGKTIAEIAEIRGVDPYDAILDLIIEEGGAINMCAFLMSEEVISTMLKSPYSLIASDSMAFAPYGVLGKTKPHPRYYGTFPRALGKYVREDHVLTLQDAVRKITSLPAQKIGLRDRGLLKEGFYADIVIFDPERIIDKATFTDPHQYPEGIEYVIVNGEIVVEKGEHTGAQAGMVLRRRKSIE